MLLETRSPSSGPSRSHSAPRPLRSSSESWQSGRAAGERDLLADQLLERRALEQAAVGVARRHGLAGRERPQAQMAGAPVVRQPAAAQHDRHRLAIGPPQRRAPAAAAAGDARDARRRARRPGGARRRAARSPAARSAPRQRARSGCAIAPSATADLAVGVELEQQAAAGEGEGEEAVALGAQLAQRRARQASAGRDGRGGVRSRRPAAACAAQAARRA